MLDFIVIWWAEAFPADSGLSFLPLGGLGQNVDHARHEDCWVRNVGAIRLSCWRFGNH
jgi:hypothetical protein